MGGCSGSRQPWMGLVLPGRGRPSTCSLPRSQAGLARDERALGGPDDGAGFPDGRPASPSSAVWPQAPGSGRPHSSRPVLGGRVGEASPGSHPVHSSQLQLAPTPHPPPPPCTSPLSPSEARPWVTGWEWLSPVAPRPPAPAGKVPARRAALGRLGQTSNPVCRPVPCLGAARSLGSARSVEGRAWRAVGRMASPGCGVAVDRALLTRSPAPSCPARLERVPRLPRGCWRCPVAPGKRLPQSEAGTQRCPLPAGRGQSPPAGSRCPSPRAARSPAPSRAHRRLTCRELAWGLAASCAADKTGNKSG